MSDETKKCPFCGEEILTIAKKCKHCGEWVNKSPYDDFCKMIDVCVWTATFLIILFINSATDISFGMGFLVAFIIAMICNIIGNIIKEVKKNKGQ